MTGSGGEKLRWSSVVGFCLAFSVASAPALGGDPTTAGDPLGIGGSAVFRMGPDATFQEGCFPPCLCPILNEQPVIGTFQLVSPALSTSGIHTYAVQEVNLLVPGYHGLRITGAGRYSVGSPNPITVLEQRMELDLQVGDHPVEHFDSGWVPFQNYPNIHVTVSIHGMFCFDRVIVFSASRVSPAEITPYTLVPGATYQQGCCFTSPCDCLCSEPRPMVGEFGLIPLFDNSLFRYLALVNARWQVVSPDATNAVALRGAGLYSVGGEFAAMHRLMLAMFLNNTGPTRFDSGLVVGGGLFPTIDILVSTQAMDPNACVDTYLHVVAKPAVGNVICGGIGGLPCPEGFFCKLPEGTCCCDYLGACAPIPLGCPDVWDPVCGCDGNTYSNECDADMAGVSIDHRGECRPMCGGIAWIPCPDGEFCQFPIGTCDWADQQGVCVLVPSICPRLWDPVCGCDGVTYSNECEAIRAGAQIDHRGECRRYCDGISTVIWCEPNEFCKYAIGNCTFLDGTCASVPQVCPTIYDPVCGCNGVTYSNECEADMARAPIAHRGPCQQVCGGFIGIPCPDGQFCKLPDGECCCDIQGVCRPIPQFCPEYYDPVCGCDGVTYSNECFASAAGVSIDHHGPCAIPPCPATRILADSDLAFCNGHKERVRIALRLANTVSAIGVEDTPPAGWIVTNNISHGGTYDPVNGKVKWGPLFPPFPTELSYEVIPTPANALIRCFYGTISVDGDNTTICGDSCLTEFCCPHIPPDAPQPPCSDCPIGDCNSCNAGDCEDGAVSLCEVIGYACAWMRGCNDDLSGMTRAAFLWRNGECYCWDDAEKKWFPSPCDSAGGAGCCSSSTPSAATTGEPGAASAAVSSNGNLRSSKPVARTVPVTIEAPPGTSAVALEIVVPAGWRVNQISDGGLWDDANRKVKWGPFFESLSRTVTFEIAPFGPPRGGKRDRLRLFEPLSRMVGTVSFDGVNEPISIR